MRFRAAPALLLVLALAACGSQTPTTAATTTGVSGSASTSEPPTLGPEVPPATVVAAAVPADQLPTATGGIGEKPTLTFPATPPPSLQRVVLTEGTGPEVVAGDWLSTNYLGQVWNGTVFDNSYDRGTPSAFQIGVGAVVPGWDVGLVGVKVGSRVLLSLPPADGYGSAGRAPDIGGADTLVFVIDVLEAYGKDAGGQTDAAVQPPPANAPQVTGELGKPPTITIPAGLAEPTAPTANVLATGTGPAVIAGSVLAQYVVIDWAGQPQGSTWPDEAAAAAGQGGTGPMQVQIAPESPLAGLIGVPVGSRVLVQLPGQTDPQSGQAQPAAAVVVDIVAQTG